MTSWQCNDRTFWNQQNDKTNLQKLLLFTDETESKETYSTMQTMSEKQIKTTQIIWETTTVRSIKWVMKIDHNEFYYQVIKI